MGAGDCIPLFQFYEVFVVLVWKPAPIDRCDELDDYVSVWNVFSFYIAFFLYQGLSTTIDTMLCYLLVNRACDGMTIVVLSGLDVYVQVMYVFVRSWSYCALVYWKQQFGCL